MKEMKVYYGSLDLRELRKTKNMTVEQLALLIHCSTRTVNRFEHSNWIRDRQTAQKIAEIFSAPFEQLFVPAEQHFLEALKSIVPEVAFGTPLEGTTYYCLYVRRISWWDANLWGKTMWIGDYDQAHELRKLHALSEAGTIALYAAGIPVISCEDEWKAFFYCATIGRTSKVIVSEECLRACVPHALYHYAVHRKALHTDKLPLDVILLGDYKNAPEIFSVRRLA